MAGIFTRDSIINLVVFGLLVATAIGAHLAGNGFAVTLATKAAILGLAGVGLNLALGYGGMVSFGHAAFFGIGGYVTGIFASHAAQGTPVLTLPFSIMGSNEMLGIWPMAMVVAGLAALAIGALSLRTTGVYFIMVTLAFAQMIYYFALGWRRYGGEDGLSFYVRNSFPGMNTFDPIQYFAICAVLLALALIFTATITQSRYGLALRAVRENSQRAVAVGIRPYAVRLTAFVLSGMIAGLAGSLYADLNRFVSPAMLSWHMSGEIMVFVILGGVARLCGPVAGAAIFILLEHLLGGLTDFWQAPLGLLLLAVVLFVPGGVIGIITKGWRHGQA
ncbi:MULTISPECIES: branched-chain amino acid ABC transporter permease [unclassified Paracoccus (in: a-proteobacteria)]|uniref:branched-chain amino acid ABC transporter permease n=1 Tax=unclassified Paracoccus (in: a-proteobacteria) TaxID=2688777 RepID=UPI0012B1DA87|nr:MULTISPECIES: branched-chain amino acid ABC transporter permease [unclassified Paracoccus (in: a-proteobacteria)]UXU74287.1 branched-chain amino acid ABC transporter permease [Paracoccus sp. SMMA_5]UXU80178.1 branched-chain amino acid ABC transporter permease [Paracoccus sp. SMMA_5_TC]